MKVGYKIFENKEGSPFFIFHGLNGSRSIPLDTKLTAKERIVRDGNGRAYLSGFHVVMNTENLDKTKNLFRITANRVTAKVKCIDVREKPNAKAGICICREFILTKYAWKNRKPM
jgi:hypothetical protein